MSCLRADQVLNNGVILINKEKGIVSHNIVQAIRRIFPDSKVGHLGTLDPAATGLLPVMLGYANRLHLYLSRGKKSYKAAIFLGLSTDSYDAEGKPTSELIKASFSREKIEKTLEQFQGVIVQIPPPFSAVKFNGKPSHRYARQGQLLELKPRQVEVYSISLDSYEDNILRVSIDCSQGTYIRSIAHDLGMKLGCGGHLQDLERTAIGEFYIDEAVSLDMLRDNPERTMKSSAFRSLEQLLPNLSVYQAPDDNARLFSCGGRIDFDATRLIKAAADLESRYQKVNENNVKVFFGDWFLGIGLIEDSILVKPIAVFGAGLEM